MAQIILVVAVWLLCLQLAMMQLAIADNTTLTARRVNTEGFGDPANRYAFAMSPFKGSLYVATLNAATVKDIGKFVLGIPFNTSGTQIYKGDRAANGTWTWTQVVKDGNGNHWNYGVRKLAVIGDYLYAVTGNHNDGLEVWCTADGKTWQVLMKNGFGDDANTSGRGLIAYQGFVYVGVENRRRGAEIWRHGIAANGSLLSNGTWQNVVYGGFQHRWNWWCSDFAIYAGHLYVGTLNFLGMQLWRSADGNHWENVFLKGNNATLNSAAMKLYVYNDTLYIGTMNGVKGASLWHNVDGEVGLRFEAVFVKGNNDWWNKYVWNMAAFHGRLYVGTFKPTGEFDVFSAAQPGEDEWITETNDAFGNAEQYGARTMEVYNDRLMIGTASDAKDRACVVIEATFKNESLDQ